VSDSRPLGFGIVGAGNIGALHSRAIAAIPEAQLVAVADPVQGRAQALAAPLSATWYTDYADLMADDAVDVINVCVPSGLHKDIAIAAAQAGKHVLVEKPIEITVERVDEIIQACREHNVKLGGIFQSRFAEGARQAKEAIDAGRLGRLVLCDAYVKWHRTQAYYDRGEWRGTWAIDGGGALMNQSVHTIDLLQWLAGPLEDVYAHTATLVHCMETEDTAAALVTFRSGAMGVIEGTTGACPGYPAKLELSGDRGTIVLEDGIITHWQLTDASPEEGEAMLQLEESKGTGASDPMAISYEKHRRQIEDFVSAVREDRPPLVDGIEARKAVAIIQAIYQSAKTGARVAVDL
jgi:UDP-N-acetyl-2-amino-2-deoxyglucuronate dehydrogenase